MFILLLILPKITILHQVWWSSKATYNNITANRNIFMSIVGFKTKIQTFKRAFVKPYSGLSRAHILKAQVCSSFCMHESVVPSSNRARSGFWLHKYSHNIWLYFNFYMNKYNERNLKEIDFILQKWKWIIIHKNTQIAKDTIMEKVFWKEKDKNQRMKNRSDIES